MSRVLFVVVTVCFACISAATVSPPVPVKPAAERASEPRSPINVVTQPPSSQGEDDFNPKKEDHSQFDWRLTKALLSNNPQNVILSPISVKILLTLLSEASGDNTKTQQELSHVIPFGNSNIMAREFFGQFFNSIKDKSDDYTLDIATNIFADSFVTPQQRYRAILERYYSAGVVTEDFSKAGEVSEKINHWVSNVTQGHIKEFVKPADVESAVMLMINAVYFKGLWRQPFFPNMTFTHEFRTSKQVTKPTPVMSQTANFFYVESSDLKAKILRLPYLGQKFAMYLILPNDAEDFDQFVAQLDSSALHNAKWLMDETEVRVIIPKFKFNYSASLNQVLQSLGIQQIFTDEASLPLLSRGSGLEGRLKVSNVIQKSGLVVDEEGSTAFAATEVGLVNKFGGDSLKYFVADRPFVFMIEDERTSAILFTGKVVDPTL